VKLAVFGVNKVSFFGSFCFTLWCELNGCFFLRLADNPEPLSIAFWNGSRDS
jgi:hypothetical protein